MLVLVKKWNYVRWNRRCLDGEWENRKDTILTYVEINNFLGIKTGMPGNWKSRMWTENLSQKDEFLNWDLLYEKEVYKSLQDNRQLKQTPFASVFSHYFFLNLESLNKCLPQIYQIFKLFYEQFEGVGTGSRQNPGNFLQWTSGQIEKDLMTVHGSAVATDIVTTLPVAAFFMSPSPCRTYYWYFREHSWSKISQLNAQSRIFPIYIFQQDYNLRTVWLVHLLMAESGA